MPPKRKLVRTAPRRGNEAAAAICSVIRRIPKGWVATYGQVAAMAGLPRRARLVGHVLRHLDPAPIFPGIASSTRKARCPTPSPAMAPTPSSSACWKRKESSSTTGTASTWSDSAGPNRNGGVGPAAWRPEIAAPPHPCISVARFHTVYLGCVPTWDVRVPKTTQRPGKT
jgi:6-O-methylguanine DNA methyltransferase, DNA binding domain